MDNADYVTLMLMDKGYYDYDFEAPKEIQKRKTYEESVKSDEELREILGRFGWGKKPMSAEQLQSEVMEEEKKKQAALRSGTK